MIDSKQKNISLVIAVADRNSGAVTAALEKGADVHYQDDLPLRSAVYLGYTDIAGLLLKNGANVHTGGEELLFIALKAHDMPMIDLLLEKGADVKVALAGKKDKLDKESLNIIGEIQARETRIAFEKNASALREKTRQSVRPRMKPNLL